MVNCSRWILLAITGLLCLLGQGLGARLPADEPEDNVPIDELIIAAANEPGQSHSPLYFSAKTHLVRSEYDMVFTLDELARLEEHKNREKRTAAIRPNWYEKRWTNNLVNYQLESGAFSSSDKLEIYRSVRDLTHYTCLKLKETSSAYNRILIQRGSGGCYSRVGMVGGTQELGLSRGCRVKRIIIHELLHAIGIHHEQTRPDRDDYVTIRFDRIDDNMEYNFHKNNWGYINNYSLPYDYLSVMHYGPTAFTTTGGVTIQTNDRRYQHRIGQSPGLSYYDVRTLNSMHSCVPSTCSIRDSDCARDYEGGFVGKDCTCWCPGPDNKYHPLEYCAQKDIDAYGSLNKSCRDLDDNCAARTRQGDCDTDTTGYMFTYCGNSCGQC